MASMPGGAAKARCECLPVSYPLVPTIAGSVVPGPAGAEPFR